MSTTSTASTVMTAAAVAPVAQRQARPTFVGTLGGELFKITRQRTNWILGVALVTVIAVPYLFYLATPDVKASLHSDPLSSMFTLMDYSLGVLRVASGLVLLIVAAQVVGLEYQLGTIRILLARGVGRLELLGAKVAALAVVALAVLVGDLVLNAVLTSGLLLVETGNLHALTVLTSTFWGDTWIYLLTVAVSMGVTILLAVAAAVVGRSLAFGIAVGLSWFPADNIGDRMMVLLNHFTLNDFWLKITAYFLGPNLNLMPAVVVPARIVTQHTATGVHTVAQTATAIGFTPLVSVDGTHTLVVALVYGLIFAAVAVVLTWRRDVLE